MRSIFQNNPDKGESLGAANQCIYCGTSNGQLTKEHLIPFGLNGTIVLSNASCAKCANITSQSEQVVLQKTFLMVRKLLKFRSRRKQWKNIEETFACLFFPIQEPPAYITRNNNYNNGVNIHSFKVVTLSKPNPQINKNHRAVINNHFERMLAKIALGFAVAKYGVDSFSKIYIQNVILGLAEDVGRWVGTDEKRTLPTAKHSIHTVGISEQSFEVTARIRLFSMYEVSPEYTVSVGLLKNDYSIRQ